MGSRLRELGVIGTILAVLSCAPGNVAFREGQRAELHKDWDTALVNYQKAVQSQPDNSHFLIHERVARTQAAIFHIKRGRRLLADGRADDAAGEFQKAVSIDPSNEAAAQELGKLLAAQAAAKRARETALKQALKATEEVGAQASVQLKPFPTEPIAHLRITADSRKVYETLAKLANINVAFHADFAPRPLAIDLSDIKIEDALRVVALQSKTFWRPVTPNTILVIPDTAPNRRDYDVEEVRTVYLTNPLAAADRTAITTALKQVLGLQRIVDNPDSNAIIIRDSPAKVAAAEQLIRQLDRGKAEILVNVTVLEASRDRIRDLGLTPATVTASGTPTPGIQTGAVFAPPASSSSTTTTSTASAIGLGQLSYRDYSVVLPSAVASAVLNDSRTHILQNPHVRVTDGQTAKLRIGSRIPIATGSFLPSFGGVSTGATGGFGLLASTQFQFQDVGVNLDLTPHLLSNGEVALHATIEISSLGAPVSVGGFSQYSFGQRKIEHDIRLKEGEVNLLGGLIQTTETRTATGVPGLGDLPVLKYMFSTQHRELVETEVLVMLTPQVVRLPEPAAAGISGVAVGGGEARPSAPEALPIPETPPPGAPGQPP